MSDENLNAELTIKFEFDDVCCDLKVLGSHRDIDRLKSRIEFWTNCERELAELKSRIDGGYRVDAFKSDNGVRATDWNGSVSCNATLVLDEGAEL